MHWLLTLLVLSTSVPASDLQIPDDFPRFLVPGHEAAMDSLRDLFYRHYVRSGPLATLWDEWISGPTLWPALESGSAGRRIRERWADALSHRIIDDDGYVATHQHASIAHQLGWPFPFWAQGGAGVWGWHFSLQGVPGGWHGTTEKTQEGWERKGCTDEGIADHAWNVSVTEPGGRVVTPQLEILPDQSPFIQLRWRARGLGRSQPYLEWTTKEEASFSPERRFYFAPIESDGIVSTMIPVYSSPAWTGTITRLGVSFGRESAGAKVGIQALFTQYDTRHNINSQNFVRGCAQYFWWTRDLNFLRRNVQRMRLAVRYVMTELGAAESLCVVTPFVGHCGRSGIERGPDGAKRIHSGRGIGNNYWDLLPMGHRDAYATMHYFDTLRDMERIEREVARHPEWGIPGGPLRLEAEALRDHADKVREYSRQIFWSPETGRFTSGIDVEGESHDYGFTFLNCEAIYYGFASDEQARSILDWLTGKRTVEGDTSVGEDIYRWRFGPRSTTRRNIEYYGWFWNAPESIPWGGQVQDGGAVLGFSYHDVMSRLRVLGPDSAWTRLEEVIRWHDEVQAAGGCREYYKDGTRGTLQGGGTAGGLGVDQEFFESILVPQVVIDGFLGFEPTATGFRVGPRLPSAWPELAVTRIHLHDWTLRVRVDSEGITVDREGAGDEPLEVEVTTPDRRGTYRTQSDDGETLGEGPFRSPGVIRWSLGTRLRVAWKR